MNDSSQDSRRRFLKTLGATTVSGVAFTSCDGEKDAEVPSTPQDLHVCMGLNTLPVTKGGKSYPAGECQCANITPHACASGNSCANLGACGTGGYETQYWITENRCGKSPAPSTAWNGTGGCGVPIGNSNTGYISTQLNNASPTANPDKPGEYYPTDFIGKPVWNIARARFEKKMVDAKKAFGKPAKLRAPLTANTYDGSAPYQRNSLPEPYPQPAPPKPEPPKA